MPGDFTKVILRGEVFMLGRNFKGLKLLGVALILMALSATVACGGSAAPTASDSGTAKDSSVSEPKTIPTSVPKSADAEPASEGGDMVISVSSYLGFRGLTQIFPKTVLQRFTMTRYLTMQ